MSKKHKKHPEHVNLERWLVSYADFITLLFAFFVVMFSSSQVDRSKTKKMSLAIESAFDSFSIFKFQSGDTDDESRIGGAGGNAKQYREYLLNQESGKSIILPPELDAESGTVAPQGDPELSQNTGMLTSQEKAMERAQRTLMDLFKADRLQGSVEVSRDLRGIIISLKDVGVFEGGGDKLTAKSQETLKAIGDLIRPMPNQVRVEGHTDDGPVNSRFASNWELSVSRATHIIDYFIKDHAIEPARFIAVGYGQYRPIAENSTEEGKIKNRRVDIVILSDDASKKEAAVPAENKGMSKADDSFFHSDITGKHEVHTPYFKEEKVDDKKGDFKQWLEDKKHIGNGIVDET